MAFISTPRLHINYSDSHHMLPPIPESRCADTVESRCADSEASIATHGFVAELSWPIEEILKHQLLQRKQAEERSNAQARVFAAEAKERCLARLSKASRAIRERTARGHKRVRDEVDELEAAIDVASKHSPDAALLEEARSLFASIRRGTKTDAHAAKALNIVMQVQEKGNGFEAWRLLHKEHKPQIAGQFFFLREVSTAHTCAGGELQNFERKSLRLYSVNVYR